MKPDERATQAPTEGIRTGDRGREWWCWGGDSPQKGKVQYAVVVEGSTLSVLLMNI